MRKIIKELAGWLVYIVIVVIIAWGFGNLCSTEDAGKRVFYGDDIV